MWADHCTSLVLPAPLGCSCTQFATHPENSKSIRPVWRQPWPLVSDWGSPCGESDSGWVQASEVTWRRPVLLSSISVLDQSGLYSQTDTLLILAVFSVQGCRFCRANNELFCRHSGSGVTGWLMVFWKASCCSCMRIRLACCRSASRSSAVWRLQDVGIRQKNKMMIIIFVILFLLLCVRKKMVKCALFLMKMFTLTFHLKWKNTIINWKHLLFFDLLSVTLTFKEDFYPTICPSVYYTVLQI